MSIVGKDFEEPRDEAQLSPTQRGFGRRISNPSCSSINVGWSYVRKCCKCNRLQESMEDCTNSYQGLDQVKKGRLQILRGEFKVLCMKESELMMDLLFMSVGHSPLDEEVWKKIGGCLCHWKILCSLLFATKIWLHRSNYRRVERFGSHENLFGIIYSFSVKAGFC